MKKGKWFKYWKMVQGRESASDYFFIPEEQKYKYDNEDTHLQIVEDWSLRVNDDGSNYGFEYGFDDIDYPPKEWIQNKIKGNNYKILELQEEIEFLKTINNK